MNEETGGITADYCHDSGLEANKTNRTIGTRLVTREQHKSHNKETNNKLEGQYRHNNKHKYNQKRSTVGNAGHRYVPTLRYTGTQWRQHKTLQLYLAQSHDVTCL